MSDDSQNAPKHDYLISPPTYQVSQISSAQQITKMSGVSKAAPDSEYLASEPTPAAPTDHGIHVSQVCTVTQNTTYLTSLPPEILIKVLSEVPLSSFLDLTHTSHGMSDFVKCNAARICNMAIASHFAYEAKLMKAYLHVENGWCFPDHGDIGVFDYRFALQNWLGEMKSCVEGTCEHFDMPVDTVNVRPGWAGCRDVTHSRQSREGVRLFTLLGKIDYPYEEDNTYLPVVETPGPQYLHLLDSVPLRISDRAPLSRGVSAIKSTSLYFWFDTCLFVDFMDTFNVVQVDVRDGKARRKERGFPRELIWYFGVDKLVLGNEKVAKSKGGDI